MSTLKLCFTGVLIGLAIVVFIQIIGRNVSETYHVVKSGDCYSYKVGRWVSSDCFESFNSASEFMDKVKMVKKKREAAHRKAWVKVEE